MASYCFPIIQHMKHEWINNYLENAWILTCLSSKKASKKQVPCFTQKFSSNSQKLTKLSPWMSSHTNKNLPWITYKNKHIKLSSLLSYCKTLFQCILQGKPFTPLPQFKRGSQKLQSSECWHIQTNKQDCYILQYTAVSLPPQGHNWLTYLILFFLSPPCGSILSFLLLSKQITRSPIHQWILILFKNPFIKIPQ